MTLTPVTFQRFGGLNLAVDAFKVAATGAVEVYNIDVDRGGQIKTRPGMSTNFASETATAFGGLVAFENASGSLRQFVVAYANGATLTYAAYASTGGAAVTTAAPAAAVITGSARYGDTSNEYLFIANGVDTVWLYDGATFGQPAGIPIGKHLAVTLTSNRLVVAEPGIASKVSFSDPGAPGTFGANNFVNLTPGDGSEITGLASFQNDIYAFKGDRFFVFYGESTDADGEPVFNYRSMDGYGSLIPPVAGDEGVYFFDGRAVWLTSGGVPRRISEPVEAFINNTAAVAGATVDRTNLVACRLFYAGGRLYFAFPTGPVSGVTEMLVFDPKLDAWTLYTLAGYGGYVQWVAQLKAASTDAEYAYTAFMPSSSLMVVRRYDRSLSTDAGTAITWAYTTGKYTLDDAGRVTVAPETSVVGGGTVTVTVSSDLYSGQGGAVSLPSGGVDAWVPTVDQEGRWMQTTFSGTGAMTVTQLKHYVSSAKPAGVS